MLLPSESIKRTGTDDILFVWFWPNRAPAVWRTTQDVETSAGLAFVPKLMDIDDAGGSKAALQLVSEEEDALPGNLNVWPPATTGLIGREPKIFANGSVNGNRSPAAPKGVQSDGGTRARTT